MSLLRLLTDLSCSDKELIAVIRIVRWVFNAICIVVPIVIIILIVIDVAKVATAGNVDDKMKKEAGQKAVTRIVYAIIIFLVPTIVSLIFRLVPVTEANKNSIINCWNGEDVAKEPAVAV